MAESGESVMEHSGEGSSAYIESRTGEPAKKKCKIDESSEAKQEKLEQRLGGILCCAVCLDLPRTVIYQVRI